MKRLPPRFRAICSCVLVVTAVACADDTTQAPDQDAPAAQSDVEDGSATTDATLPQDAVSARGDGGAEDAGDAASGTSADTSSSDVDSDVETTDVLATDALLGDTMSSADSTNVDGNATVDAGPSTSADAASPDSGAPSDTTAPPPPDGFITGDSVGANDALGTDAGWADAVAADTVTKPGWKDPAKLPMTKFSEATKDFGINPNGYYSACVAAGDINNDGADDFLVIERKSTKAVIWSHLLGGAKPQQVSVDFDTTTLHPSLGCQLFDFDGDGNLDLLVGGASGIALYAGDGKAGFQDMSSKWLPFILNFEGWATAPVDLDGDGDLDLFVGAGSGSDNPNDRGPGPACGTSNCGYQDHDFICALAKLPPNMAIMNDRVLIRGAKLPLVDATKTWGPPTGGILSSTVPIDLDGDGKMDMLVGDDFGAHRYLRNVGGKFQAHATNIGFYNYGHAMGWGIGDLNDDGKADLILADVGPVPVYVQVTPTAGEPVKFVDKGGELGIWDPLWATSSWAPLVEDFDLDGRDDIMFGGALNTTPDKMAAVTAACSDGKSNPWAGHANIDTIFLSDGQPTGKAYKAQQFGAGPYSNFNTMAQVAVDIDGDGDLDVVQSRPHFALFSRIRIWRNELPKKGKSATVVLTGKKGNMDAVGARVTAQIGGVLRTRWLVGGGGFGGTRLRRAHFGLGAAGKATVVTVHWPDGKTTKLPDLLPGTVHKATWP